MTGQTRVTCLLYSLSFLTRFKLKLSKSPATNSALHQLAPEFTPCRRLYTLWRPKPTNLQVMASNAAKSAAKVVGEYQYPWREKLAKHKDQLAKGVWGYWELGAWKSLSISGRRRAQLRKEVLLAGEDWPYDPEKKEMRTKMKGHKCDRISAEKRENTARLMEKMPEMLRAYRKRRWEKKMKEEDKNK